MLTIVYLLNLSWVHRQIMHVANNIKSMMQKCPIPRSLRFEPSHSDGHHRGATLSFLADKHLKTSVATSLTESCTLTVNPVVSVMLKVEDGERLIVQLLSVSGLSNMEYIRFAIYCSSCEQKDGMQVLVTQSPVCCADIPGFKHPDMIRLLRVLLYANVISVDTDHLKGDEGNGVRRKRQKH